jgi:hypothetical protein
MSYQFTKFFSVDSPKAIKAQSFGWLNAINYMAPAHTAGVGDLCPWSSAGCRALCLGEHSGQAAMHAPGQSNAVLESRKAKAIMFMKERAAFMRELDAGIARAERQAKRLQMKLCVRLNGSTDINWLAVIKRYPHIQFVDYTKSVARALAHAAGKLPSNYHVTFSRSEANEADCRAVLAAGGNVAVVFGCDMPRSYLGRPVVSGDDHDLRHLDPKGGFVIGLTPKGMKAKRDTSGFVVWSCDLTMAEAA